MASVDMKACVQNVRITEQQVPPISLQFSQGFRCVIAMLFAMLSEIPL